MFLTFIFIWHAFGSAFGCVANLLLLYAVITKTPKQTKSYATLIINFALTDFTECLMDIFIQLRFIIPPFDVTYIYVFHGLCQYTGPLSCKIGLSIFYHCFPHNVWSLLLSFSYRYYVLHHPVIPRRILSLIILMIYIPSFIQAVIYWPTIADRETILPLANKFFPQYDLAHVDGLLAGIPTIKDFASIYVIAHLCVPIFPVYVAIFVLRHKVIKELLKKTGMLSKDAKSYHSQILKCLTIQAIIPFIFVIGVLSYLSAQLGIFTNPILEYSIFACTLPMPMFSPFTYLLYIKPYRMFCARLLRRRKDVETSLVERSKQVFSI
ncbi:hypothetical protein GCK72_017252 [Caenorhabditis remanei]|uniref:G-protein coupled receptors family 1 profile domain-containing protein n=1 Tax=Caenorhabditis remanei TaxID=31234 RepID=A0A6A5G7K3_CAERE|nr:hypothetical protein GCK72_017252 [Caenorhabditis remanei]KAF1750701.1 hypothetical protein GCK72_017252 [Caenorhabditis remanei]